MRARPTQNGWTACRYGSSDEALHDPGRQRLYNESVYVNFVTDREDGPLGGILRVGLRPADGYAELSLNLPLADGSTVFLYEREPLAPEGFVAGSSEWRCAGMRLEVTEPTRRWRLGYEGSRPRRVTDPGAFGLDPGAALRASRHCAVMLDLTFDARFPMHALSRTGDLVPGGRTPFARDHYEQFGAVTGTLELDGRTHPIRGAAFRDHSWGPRDWQATPNTDFITILCDDGPAIVAFSARLGGAEHMHGVRWARDGLQQLARFEVETDYDGGVTISDPLSVTVGVAGQDVRYEGTVRAFLPLRHRSGEQIVRIGQTLIDYSGGSGRARGWSDLTRPA